MDSGIAAPTVEERVADAHRALVAQLERVAGEMRRQTPSALRSWLEFAGALRGWMSAERDWLLPLVESRLGNCTDRGRLRLEHAQLERLLVRATAQVERGAPDGFADVAHQLLLRFHRHAMREQRRFATQLDRLLTAEERQQLLRGLPLPAAVH